MERITVYTQPASSVAEAYRALCINVLAGVGEKRLIEVAGVSNNVDASLVIANLAVALAQAGKHVLVMDCNLRSPKQHEVFGVPNRGVTECLASTGSIADFVQQTVQQNLQVLPAGATISNPIEKLLSTTFENMLSEVKTIYDVVLLDVPAVGVISDAVALGTKTDGILLVLANKKDKVEQAQKAKEMFIQAGVPVLGCVLDKA